MKWFFSFLTSSLFTFAIYANQTIQFQEFVAHRIVDSQSEIISDFTKRLLPSDEYPLDEDSINFFEAVKEIAAYKLTEHFTCQELLHLLNFYESDLGRSIQKKAPLFAIECFMTLTNSELFLQCFGSDVEVMAETNKVLQENFPELSIPKKWEGTFEELFVYLTYKYFTQEELAYAASFEGHPLSLSIAQKLPAFVIDLTFSYLGELGGDEEELDDIQEDVIEIDLE